MFHVQNITITSPISDKMKALSYSCFGFFAVAVLTQVANGQVLFSDDFNSYATDAALTAVWTRASGTTANVGLAADPDAGNSRGQGIFQLNPSSNAGQLTKTLGSGVTPTDANPVIFSFDFYDVNGGSTSGRDYVELRNSAGTGGLFDAGLINSVTTGTYVQGQYQARNLDSGAWIQLATPRSAGWHHFEFDIRATTVDLKIDGNVDPNFTNLHWNGGASYNLIKVGSALSSNTGANYDNISLSVATVPEPGALGFASLGCMAWVVTVVRRRRHQD
jgi:hypothetical protein